MMLRTRSGRAARQRNAFLFGHTPVSGAGGAGDPRNLLEALLRGDGLTVADYDASLGVTGDLAVSSWANQIGAAGALDGTGHAPIYLPFSGDKYAYIPNANSNTITTPATASLIPVSTISIRIDAAFDDETKGSWANHSGAAGNGGWLVDGGGAGGKLRFSYTNDGTTFRIGTTSVAPTVSAGQRLSYRFDYVIATGKVDFYTAPDFATWAALGTQQTITAGTIFNTTAVLRFGNRNANDDPAYGKWYRYQVWVDGVLVKNWNAADWPETSTNGATQASSTTGEIWTLNNTGAKPAQIVGSASLMGDGTALYLQATATIPSPYCIISVEKANAWTSGDVSFDGKTANSFAFQQITGSPQGRMHDGAADSATIAPALGSYNIITASQAADGTTLLQLNSGTPVSATMSATALAGITAFADGSGANQWAGQKKRLIVLSAIPSSGKLAQIQGLLRQIYGTP